MTPEELHNISRAERTFWWYQGMRAIVRAYTDPLVKLPGGMGLDAGCGTCYNAVEFERLYGLRMVGVDVAPLALRYSRQRDFTRSVLASATELPFPAERFDLVLCLDVLSHLRHGEDTKALAEFARVLRPGGWLVLRVPAFHLLRSRHSQFISEQQRFRAGPMLARLSPLGLRPVRWSYANSFLSPIAFIKSRFLEPLLGAAPRSGVDSLPPAWLNRLLGAVLLCEAAMLRRGFRFLYGQSLMVVAQKPVASDNT